jgi:hypothetical protein
MHLDDAFDFLIERLTALPDWTGPMAGNARNATYGCDLWIPQIVAAYWQPRITGFTIGDLSDEHFRPFYDAAWELARIGVLRPGAFMPRGMAMGGQLFSGDGSASHDLAVNGLRTLLSVQYETRAAWLKCYNPSLPGLAMATLSAPRRQRAPIALLII